MDKNFVKVGKWGSCLWGINDNVELFINEGEAESVAAGGVPWEDSAAAITSAVSIGEVTFPEGASLEGLFRGCKNMTKADLSGFITGNVVNMNSMFEGCAKLKELDLTSFDTRRCKDMSRMFGQCAALSDILLSPEFSTDGDGTTDCGKLAVKEYGRYKKAKTIFVEGFKVIYHSNQQTDLIEERQTIPNSRYMIEEPLFDAPSDRAAFVSWNTQADGKGDTFMPNRSMDSVDEDIDLYAIWAYAPEIRDVSPLRSITYGEPIPFEIPEIVSVNDPEVTGFLEISKNGEEGTWHAIDHNTILPVSFNGYLIRLRASNSVGEAVSNAVRLSIRKASIDTSTVRWAEEASMVYDGLPKEVHVEGLPAGIEPKYEGNVATEAGTYTASFEFVFDQENFNDPIVIREHEWTIRKAVIDMSGVRWNSPGLFDYDGTVKEVSLTGLPEGVTAEYENNSAVNAGIYTATARLLYDHHNYELSSDVLPCTWEIKRAVIDADSLEWSAYDSFVYDGTAKSVHITNLPEDATVEYDGEAETLAGKYLARAVFTGNYCTAGAAEYEWEIAKKHYDLSGAEWTGSGEFIYDGHPHGMELSGVPEELIVRYTGNSGIAAGNYNARAMFINPDTHNYVTPEDIEMQWSIKKQTVDMSGVHWDYSGAFTYDGEAKSIRLIGLPDSIKVDYENNMAFNAGEYNAHASLRYDDTNLEVMQPADCQWRINKRRIDVSSAYWAYTDAFTFDGTEHGVYLNGIPEGVDVEYTDNIKINTGTYTASASLTPADKLNYDVPEINGCTWAIKKAEWKVGSIEWTDSSDFVYDGKVKNVEIVSGLGDNVSAEYEHSAAVNAGRYYAKAIFSLENEANYVPPKPVGYSWSIAKAHYDMSGVIWDYENAFTYDGNEKSVKLNGVPDGIIVSYKNASATDAGDYTAVATFEVQDSNNYETDVPEMILDWTIKKAVYDMSGAKWVGDKEYTYDGEEKGAGLRLTGLPDGLIPVYSGNTAVSAGDYIAKARFSYDEKNYEEPAAADCHWIIEKAPVDVSGIEWTYDKAFVYDGSEKRVAVSDIPEGARVEYTNAGASDAGTYVAAAEIIPNDTENRVKGRLENLTWRIERGEYDMSHARWDYDKDFTYDGSEHTVVIKGLPEGVTPVYRGNTAVDAGDYRASVSFIITDERNFNMPVIEDLEWTVKKADYDMSGASWDYDGEFKYNGRMYEVSLRGLPEGVRAVYKGNVAADTGFYTASAELIPYDQDNYNNPVIGDCRWSIAKADYDMGAVRWDYGTARIYNGRPQNVMLEHLPYGVIVSYSGNEAVDAGKYTAAAELSVSDPKNYNVPSVSDCDWEIIRAEYDMGKVAWDYTDGEFTYDGSRKKIELKYLPEGVSAKYTGNSAIFAGEYNATACFEVDNGNFEVPASISMPWSIGKAEYDMSSVTWDYKAAFTYDGSPKRVELIGIPEGLSVEYTDNSAVDAGLYTATAHFSNDTTDYSAPEDMYCTWEIEKADIDIRRIAWDYSQSFVYDGFLKKIELKDVPDLLEVSYSGNTAEVAGHYTAHADLMPVRPENYRTPVMRDCSWEIVKADYDMSDARWDGEFEFVYDGSEKSVFITGLPEGVTPVYHDNKAVDAGSYEASVDLICDADNYNVPEMGSCKWSIKKTSYDMSDVAWYTDEKIVYDGKPKSIKLKGLPAGLTPVYEGNEAVDAGDYEATVTFRNNDKNYIDPVFGGCKWHISPADIEIDLSQISWEYDGPFVYDGEPKTVRISEITQEQGLLDKLRGRKLESGLAGIPDGFDVVYQNNTAAKAGVYYASAKLVSREESNNYNELVLPQFKWEITKARIDISDVRWNYNEDLVYDGEEKRIELINLPDTVAVSYVDNCGTDAGEHEALANIEVKDPDNYEAPKPVSGCWWHIDKARYDLSKVRWSYDDDIVYNGKEKVVRLIGLPEGVKVEAYRGNKAIEAGNYTAEAIINYRNKENYEEPDIPALKWRIRKRKIDTSDIAWNYDESTLFVFDDKPKEVKLIGVPKDIEVVYIDNSKINAGTYTAKARLIYDTRNCEVDEVPDLRWKIGKAVFDTSDVRWSYTGPFRYDGNEKSIMLQGVPHNIDVRYRDNRASAIGTYTAKAYLTYDSDNYEAPEIQTTIDWDIVSREDFISGTEPMGAWNASDSLTEADQQSEPDQQSESDQE